MYSRATTSAMAERVVGFLVVFEAVFEVGILTECTLVESAELTVIRDSFPRYLTVPGNLIKAVNGMQAQL